MKFKYKVKKPMAAWVSGNFKTLNEYCSGLLQEGKQHPAHVTLDNA
jgi:hypothetical protein